MKINLRQFQLVVFIAFLSTSVYAQPNNLFKIDIHSPVGRTGILAYERVMNEHSTLGLSLLYTDKTEMFGNSAYLSRLAVSPEFRFYLTESQNAPEGFYLMANLRYQHLIADDYNYIYDPLYNPSLPAEFVTRELDTFGAGVSVGYQAIFKEHVCIDIFAGTVFNSGEDRSEPYIESTSEYFEPYVGYFITTGVRVGYGF